MVAACMVLKIHLLGVAPIAVQQRCHKSLSSDEWGHYDLFEVARTDG